jgi:sugar phosphate permease
MNAIGIPGRLICGLAADKLLGPINALIPVTFCAGALLYIWIRVSTPSGLFGFCIAYGFFAAGVQSLFPAACASLSSTDMSKVGIRTGMCFSLVSVSCLTGPPIAGALVQRREGDFLFAQVFGGTALVGVLLRFLLRGWRVKVGWMLGNACKRLRLSVPDTAWTWFELSHSLVPKL